MVVVVVLVVAVKAQVVVGKDLEGWGGATPEAVARVGGHLVAAAAVDAGKALVEVMMEQVAADMAMVTWAGALREAATSEAVGMAVEVLEMSAAAMVMG